MQYTRSSAVQVHSVWWLLPLTPIFFNWEEFVFRTLELLCYSLIFHFLLSPQATAVATLREL